MRVLTQGVEEGWQDDNPAYLVMVWTKPNQPPPPGVEMDSMGWRCAEYTVAEADADDVLAWARATAAGNPFTLFAICRTSPDIGLIRLQGFEPTAVRSP